MAIVMLLNAAANKSTRGKVALWHAINFGGPHAKCYRRCAAHSLSLKHYEIANTSGAQTWRPRPEQAGMTQGPVR